MCYLIWAGIVALPVHVVSVIVFAALEPNYSHLHQSVSMLGAFSASNTFAMNLFGLFLPGLLVVAFSYACREYLKPFGVSGLWVGNMLFLFGLMFAGLALPMDMGPIWGADYTVHYILAYSAVMPFLFATLFTIVLLPKLGFHKGQTLALVILPIIFVLTKPMALFQLPSGLVQRMLLLSIFTWISILSVSMLGVVKRH